ncbi:MAG: aminopeptidase P family N-terminal domain-containing protein, partial [Pseudomonadota bacterium]
MGYRDLVKDTLDELNRSFGYQYTPKVEIEERIDRFRAGMRESGIEAALIIQKMDGYYFSGTTQDSLLFIPLDGSPLLLVKREIERARVET